MNDKRLIEIESRIAFLEHTIDELNDVVLAVRDQIDRMEKELAKTRELLEAGAEANIDTSFRKPPHY